MRDSLARRITSDLLGLSSFAETHMQPTDSYPPQSQNADYSAVIPEGSPPGGADYTGGVPAMDAPSEGMPVGSAEYFGSQSSNADVEPVGSPPGSAAYFGDDSAAASDAALGSAEAVGTPPGGEGYDQPSETQRTPSRGKSTRKSAESASN